MLNKASPISINRVENLRLELPSKLSEFYAMMKRNWVVSGGRDEHFIHYILAACCWHVRTERGFLTGVFINAAYPEHSSRVLGSFHAWWHHIRSSSSNSKSFEVTAWACRTRPDFVSSRVMPALQVTVNTEAVSGVVSQCIQLDSWCVGLLRADTSSCP